ncbi:MAG: peptide deformylase [Anaerolineaceae bacterium]|nr:peptide deformylase [Anaerolineaceae bacterium]MBN2677564.1 peptide deformylase [Anaerolineaceae bacterium]
MTTRKILIYPEQQDELRKPSTSVDAVNRPVRRIIRDLRDTLEAHGNGVGLAAPQINIHQNIVLVCVGTESEGGWQAGPPRALINPQITLERDERKDFDGCLSFPGLYGETIRPHYIQVVGQDENGQAFDEIFEGFNAVVVHHEIDHLKGVLFIDRLQTVEDLYTLQENERGEITKVPFYLKR